MHFSQQKRGCVLTGPLASAWQEKASLLGLHWARVDGRLPGVGLARLGLGPERLGPPPVCLTHSLRRRGV